MSEHIADCIYDGSKAHKLLLDAIHLSDCPHVAKLVDLIKNLYIEQNADDLALYFEERGE